MRSVGEHPLVSTVIPVFNRPLRLREAVASVLAQDWRSLEIIIVDDGSTDGGATWSVAEALIAENPGSVVGLRQANAGPGAARQRGVSAAQGEFLQFLDSDDVYHPQKTSRLMRALEKAPSAGIAYCDSVRRSSNGIVGPDTGHRGSETHHTIFPRCWRGACGTRMRCCIDAPSWSRLAAGQRSANAKIGCSMRPLVPPASG